MPKFTPHKSTPTLVVLSLAAFTGAARAQDAQVCRMDTLCEPDQACGTTNAFEIVVGGTAAAPTVSYSEALAHPATPRQTEGGVELAYIYANQTEILRIGTSGSAELLLPGPDPQSPRVFRGACAPDQQ